MGGKGKWLRAKSYWVRWSARRGRLSEEVEAGAGEEQGSSRATGAVEDTVH